MPGMRTSRLSATEIPLSATALDRTALSSHNLHNGTAVVPCACPFCSWGASRGFAVSKLLSTTRRKAATISSGMQTVTEMNFDGWWEVDPLLESRAMVFRTYRQTKPYFAAWVCAVVQVARSRDIMRKFLQQLRNDSLGLAFAKWSMYAEDQKKNKENEDIVYKRFKFFNQLQCLKLWRQEAASQISIRKQMKSIGFRIMNAGVNICFLTWAANAFVAVKQRSIMRRFVSLMTKGAMGDCFAAWSALTMQSVETRKTESIMRVPPYWKPPRMQYSYHMTLRLMTSCFVCVGARLYGALTSSDDAQAPPVSGHAPLEFILPSFTHLGETMLHLWP